ncbi:TVP38/TMEM64 family protein [Marisediminicola senii]|uniref:TVP38/TMEM64 family protein n=1 Tax=Marisediminicola senii TaxID=2711233 RepID=UPI001F399C42|nr:TVP38/TMEM64 family protein [Marisediminicola senii]
MSDGVQVRSRRRALVKLGVLVVFVAVAVLVGILVPLPSLDEIRTAAETAGLPGAFAFVIAYGLVTLTPVPKNVVGVAAGVIWGFALGSLLVYLGALIGAALAFAIGRALGRDAVERFTGARVDRVDTVLRRRGLASVIGVRLIPLLPFTVINYTASLTAVRVRDYAIGTAVGIIPGTLAYVAIGAFGFEPGPALYIALGALGVLTLGGVVVGARLRRRGAVVDGA